jgi:hypothetical protein
MIDFDDPTTWDSPLLDADALSLAIFALNTLKYPDGSSDEQMDAVEFFTDGALERLVALRDEAQQTAADLTISVTRSAGDDRAVLVFIDTEFEPFGSDDSPGLRVLLNDNEVYVGTAYDLGGHHEAKAKKMTVGLDEIAYTGKEVE